MRLSRRLTGLDPGGKCGESGYQRDLWVVAGRAGPGWGRGSSTLRVLLELPVSSHLHILVHAKPTSLLSKYLNPVSPS